MLVYQRVGVFFKRTSCSKGTYFFEHPKVDVDVKSHTKISGFCHAMRWSHFLEGIFYQITSIGT